MEIVACISSIMLLIDTLYSIVYFQHTYSLELKHRFVVLNKDLPLGYRMVLVNQIKNENGFLRSFIQLAYIPWVISMVLIQLWYLPLIITSIIFLSNLVYKKPYISPYMLFFNLLVIICIFGYGVISLLLR